MRTMAAYNMVTRPDEPYYARQYLHWILPELSARYPDRRVEILDLGCGQGRLSLPLAEWCGAGGGRVNGVDLTPAVVERARQYANENGVSNVVFHEGHALAFIRGMANASVDAILLIEVTYVVPSYRETLREVARVLRPGGVMFAAFRSQYYNLLSTVRDRLWNGAEMALRCREGKIFGGSAFFNWQDTEDIRLLMSEAGLRTLNLRGIGVCSGIEGDPLGAIARPSKLSALEQDRLMQIEFAVAERYAACGRYVLATAVRAALPQEEE